MGLEQLLLSVNEFARMCGIGKTMAHEIIDRGDLLSVRIGRRKLVPESEARAYVARLVAQAKTVSRLEPAQQTPQEDTVAA